MGGIIDIAHHWSAVSMTLPTTAYLPLNILTKFG
jgi:hypothetical protein